MRERILYSLLVFVLAACSPGGGDDATATDGNTAPTTTGDQGDTFPTEGGATDPGFNPEFKRVLSGTTLDAAYTWVRVGQLDLADITSGCCADYVVAGPAHNHVRILFGAPSHGLLFLSDLPDQTFTMGPATVGIDDVLVADYDEDGHDDVLALRSDGVVGIRRGLGATAPAPVLSETLLEVPMTFFDSTARRSLAHADLNCDGKRDLIAVSPEDDRLVYSLAVPGDLFSSALIHTTGFGTSPQQVVIRDLNGDGANDIVTGNGNGSASVLLNDCVNNFGAPVEYPIFSTSFDTPGMRVAAGWMCIGESTSQWPAIALGHADQVFILCGSSKGTFDAIGEEPSAAFGTAVDYIMDSNEEGGDDGATVFQLQYWDSTASLHVLWSGNPELSRFVPSPTFGQVQEGEPVAELVGRKVIMGEGRRSFALHQSQTTSSPHWTHIVRLVQGGTQTDVSFGR